MLSTLWVFNKCWFSTHIPQFLLGKMVRLFSRFFQLQSYDSSFKLFFLHSLPDPFLSHLFFVTSQPLHSTVLCFSPFILFLILFFPLLFLVDIHLLWPVTVPVYACCSNVIIDIHSQYSDLDHELYGHQFRMFSQYLDLPVSLHDLQYIMCILLCSVGLFLSQK